MTDEETARWISVREAAQTSGTTVGNIYRLMRAGTLTGEVVQRTSARQEWRLDRARFEQWKRKRDALREKHLKSDSPGRTSILTARFEANRNCV